MSSELKKSSNKSFLAWGLIILGVIAWKTYFFAGTGFAFLICAAMVIGGIVILNTKREEE